MRQRSLVFLLLLLIFAPLTPAWAQLAVPPLTGRVVDLAGILSASTEAALNDILAAHEDSTTNQIAVLTISSLEGESIESYSLRVAESWGLGRADRDNGVLVLVAKDDRKLRIEVGYGLEGTLPDALAGRVIDEVMVPAFRKQDYEGGILAGVERIVDILDGSYTPEPYDASADKPPLIFGFMFLIIPSIFFFFGVISPGFVRWFLFFFLTPFYAVSGFAFTGTGTGTLIFLGIYALLFLGLGRLPAVRRIRKKMKEAAKTGASVKVGPFSVSTSSSGGGSSGWSSGSSFSGGGGSFGGGGASGSW